MRRLLIALSAILSALTSCQEKTPAILNMLQDGEVVSIYETEVIQDGNSLVLTSASDLHMGFELQHLFDMSEFKCLRFTLLNETPMPYYFSVVLKEREVAGNGRASVPGRIQNFYMLKPYQTRTYEMAIPADLPHPEVDSCFTGMRNTPYARLTGLYSYNADVSSIKNIRMHFRRAVKGGRIIVKDIEGVYGQRVVADKALEKNHEEFFPFIDKYGQFKHADWKGKTYSDDDLQRARVEEERDLEKHPGPLDRSKFGGWVDGPRLEATGRFRVEKYDGKWWMVDPEGYLFWSHGVVRVTPSTAITPLDGRHSYFEELPHHESDFAQFYYTHDELLRPYYADRGFTQTYDFSSANCYRKYGEDYKNVFADLAHRHLLSWGLNTIANSSDKDICLMDKTPYVDRIEVRSRPIEGTAGQWLPFMDPYDDSFVERIESQLLARSREVNDPWLLGLFVDNEIHWGDTRYLARCTAMAPADQPAKIELVRCLKVKYTSVNRLNQAWGTSFPSWDAFLSSRADVPSAADADLKEFNKEIIHKYYRTIREAFDKYAPGVLYMGCRFAQTNSDVLSIGEQYCDVISYNIYSHNLKHYPFPEGFDKPVMVGEFHFGARDVGMFHSSLIEVESQQERGKAYEDYVRSALEHPNFIGTHWHQFSDQATTGRFDGENFQVGFTDCCDKPYYETIRHIRAIGYKMYEIRSGHKQPN